VGLLPFRCVANVPRAEWDERRVRDCLVPLDAVPDRGLGLLRFGPVGVRDGLDEEFDVAALPVPHLMADRTAMADVEDGVVGETRAEPFDVRQPLAVEAVGEVAVPVVVDLVAEKNRRLVVADDPGAVVRRLARAEVDDGELHVVEGHALPIADRGIWKDAVGRPVVSEHRTDDLILDGVVGRDRVDHPLRGVDRNVCAGDDLDESRVVVGVGLRHERGQERLPKAAETGTHFPGGGHLQQPVNCYHAGRSLD
jgi:hypothetical protein